MKQSIRHLIIAFLICSLGLFSQNETNNWYFGYQAALNFSTNPPSSSFNSAMISSEGSASISDASGNLLFYSNGMNVWNNSHTIMANGSGILGGVSSTQSSLIVKQPGTQNIYYLFTTDDIGQSDGLRYSIIDMNLAAGQGSVTTKNVILYTPTCEKLTGVKHCNGKDVWILSHDYNSDQFRVFLLSNSGISTTPVISAIGSSITTANASTGYLKASANGRKLGMGIGSTTVLVGAFELFDFDNINGVVSNSIALIRFGHHYGCEFSSDGSFFYGTNTNLTYTTSEITQWNLCAGSNSAIVSSSYAISTGTNLVFSMLMANNGKIYINHRFASNPYLSVINNPNSAGAAMGFSLAGQSISPSYALYGLPNFVNNYNSTIPIAPLFSNTLSCSTISFSAPAQQTVAATCSITSYPFTSFKWNFGDVGSGASNTSTLANPQHIYSATGIYTVSLIIQSPCSTDTLFQSITISTLTPLFAVSGPTAICKGENALFTASGASNYTWSIIPGASNVNSVMVNPTVTTQYSVSAMSPSTNCSYSKVFQVQVNKCTSLENYNLLDEKIMIYPIPAQEKVIVQLKDEILNWKDFEIEIINQLGQIVFQKKMEKSLVEIELSDWQKGVYLISIKSAENRAYKKLIVGY